MGSLAANNSTHSVIVSWSYTFSNAQGKVLINLPDHTGIVHIFLHFFQEHKAELGLLAIHRVGDGLEVVPTFQGEAKLTALNVEVVSQGRGYVLLYLLRGMMARLVDEALVKPFGGLFCGEYNRRSKEAALYLQEMAGSLSRILALSSQSSFSSASTTVPALLDSLISLDDNLFPPSRFRVSAIHPSEMMTDGAQPKLSAPPPESNSQDDFEFPEQHQEEEVVEEDMMLTIQDVELLDEFARWN